MTDGRSFEFKDAQVFSWRRPLNWDWKKCRTIHRPGVSPKALSSAILSADVIILTRGMDLVLQVPKDARQKVLDQGKTLKVLQSEAAAKAFNACMAKGQKVAMLMHSTC